LHIFCILTAGSAEESSNSNKRNRNINPKANPKVLPESPITALLESKAAQSKIELELRSQQIVDNREERELKRSLEERRFELEEKRIKLEERKLEAEIDERKMRAETDRITAETASKTQSALFEVLSQMVNKLQK